MSLKAFFLVLVFLSLTAAGLTAPILHDEALVLLEFAGHSRDWPAQMIRASELQEPILHSNPGMYRLLSDVSAMGYQITPDLYYVALWVWRQFAGDSLLSMRLLSTVCWAAMLCAFWQWSRSRLGLALLAVGPMAIGFAVLSRPYALTALFIVLTAWLLDPERSRNRTSIRLGLLTAVMAVMTHYFAAIPVGIVIVTRMLWLTPAARRWIVPAAGLTIATVLMAGYWYVPHGQHLQLPFRGWGAESYADRRALLRLPLSGFQRTGTVVDLISSSTFLAAICSCASGFRNQSYRLCLLLYSAR